MWIFLHHVPVIMQIALGIDKDTIQHNYLAYMYIETIKTYTEVWQFV